MLKEDPSPLTHCEHNRVGHVNPRSPDVTGRKRTHENTLPHGLCGGEAALEADDLAWNPAPDTLKLCDWEVYKSL